MEKEPAGYKEQDQRRYRHNPGNDAPRLQPERRPIAEARGTRQNERRHHEEQGAKRLKPVTSPQGSQAGNHENQPFQTSIEVDIPNPSRPYQTPDQRRRYSGNQQTKKQRQTRFAAGCYAFVSDPFELQPRRYE